MKKQSKQRRNLFFWIYSISIFISGSSFLITKHLHSELDILPILIDIRDHQEPQRVPDTFAEEFGENASKAELIFLADTAFKFHYTKSPKQANAFAGLFFPLENVDIDFSKFDKIEIGIKTDKARRIPLNFSVQNKKFTHQYVRSFIETQPDKELYSLYFEDFFTPTSWYKTNGITQAEIPPPDFSLIEAISFESCQLLAPEIEDEYTIYHLVLKKRLFWTDIIVVALVALLILLCKAIYFRY